MLRRLKMYLRRMIIPSNRYRSTIVLGVSLFGIVILLQDSKSNDHVSTNAMHHHKYGEDPLPLLVSYKTLFAQENFSLGQPDPITSPSRTFPVPESANTAGFLSQKNSSLKYILYWNEFYGSMNFEWGNGQLPFQTANCSFSNCFGTSDKTLIPIDRFDAILFHVQTAVSWPKARSPHQNYVFVTKEAPIYLFNSLRGFNNYFNLTMTYRRKSDFWIPYGDVVHKKLQELPTTGTVKKNYAKGKTKLAAWFVSNCMSRSGRGRYVRKLKRYVQVDIYGKCGTSKCPRDKNFTCHEQLLNAQYKFYLSFENSICREYVTEKFFQALKYDVVPVVLGGADYSSIAPPNSYIDALKYSPMSLASYLKKLDKNDTLYNSFFNWKSEYSIVDGKGFYKDAFCNLCRRLNEGTSGSYSNIRSWWISGQCQLPL